METLHSWNSVDRDNWSFTRIQRNTALLIFALNKLPDFSDPRFIYLNEKADERQAEIAKKQLQTLRQLHSFGEDFAFTLRIIKNENRLNLYVICRITKTGMISKEDKKRYSERIIATFPHEYAFETVDETVLEGSSIAVDSSWIKHCTEIFKNEEKYKSNYDDKYFYSSFLWAAVDNDMGLICRTMLRSDAKSAIDITLTPTAFNSDEREWIDNHMKRLRSAQMGERVLTIQYDPIPGLKTPSDNYDTLLKRYDSSRLFISSIKVYGSEDSGEIVEALISGASRTKAQIIAYSPGSEGFDMLKNSYSTLDFYPEIHPPYWDMRSKDLLFRAQRLHRIVDVEEISNFWRIPIPISGGFPGFDLDTGLSEKPQSSKYSANIELGLYGDDPAKAKIPVTFTRQQLAKHGLIVGVPGSGKTTAMFNILHQLWDNNLEDRIPFIVLEPAKTEFRALKTITRFKEDMFVFTLGDERISPFRFNPFEVLPGIPLESHISRLNACFVGAFDLFDPLPLLLDKAIRQTYYSKGWYDDSVGGEEGVVTPTLSDLCTAAEEVANNSGYSNEMRSNFNASLLQRLNSLCRGSKGRMLDTKNSIPFEVLMNKPVILELDSLNESEKALMMMFILAFVYEWCKVKRKSGSPLKHMLLVEEAHNLIGTMGNTSENRGNPKEESINLFVKMLAEMRALGEGILIAEQLPTAIAPQAVKQTNLKILMRMTAKDEREFIGNTMDLSESEMKNVVHFKTGHAYIYHESLDRVRMIEMLNFKGQNNVEEPQSDEELRTSMEFFERNNPEIFTPYPECGQVCTICNRRTRSQAELFIEQYLYTNGENSYQANMLAEKGYSAMSNGKTLTDALGFCNLFLMATKIEFLRLSKKYNFVNPLFPVCAYLHLINTKSIYISNCKEKHKNCMCRKQGYEGFIEKFIKISKWE